LLEIVFRYNSNNQPSTLRGVRGRQISGFGQKLKIAGRELQFPEISAASVKL
jgi:hypothetical protein